MSRYSEQVQHHVCKLSIRKAKTDWSQQNKSSSVFSSIKIDAVEPEALSFFFFLTFLCPYFNTYINFWDQGVLCKQQWMYLEAS